MPDYEIYCVVPEGDLIDSIWNMINPADGWIRVRPTLAGFWEPMGRVIHPHTAHTIPTYPHWKRLYYIRDVSV
jgi:hypothetical protein